MSNIASRVHSDIWDIFGTLTREQSVGLASYLQELQISGVLRMPAEQPAREQVSRGQLKTNDPEPLPSDSPKVSPPTTTLTQD